METGSLVKIHDCGWFRPYASSEGELRRADGKCPYRVFAVDAVLDDSRAGTSHATMLDSQVDLAGSEEAREKLKALVEENARNDLKNELKEMGIWATK